MYARRSTIRLGRIHALKTIRTSNAGPEAQRFLSAMLIVTLLMGVGKLFPLLEWIHIRLAEHVVLKSRLVALIKLFL